MGCFWIASKLQDFYGFGSAGTERAISNSTCGEGRDPTAPCKTMGLIPSQPRSHPTRQSGRRPCVSISGIDMNVMSRFETGGSCPLGLHSAVSISLPRHLLYDLPKQWAVSRASHLRTPTPRAGGPGPGNQQGVRLGPVATRQFDMRHSQADGHTRRRIFCLCVDLVAVALLVASPDRNWTRCDWHGDGRLYMSALRPSHRDCPQARQTYGV